MTMNNNRPKIRINNRIGSKIKISRPIENEDPHHCRCFRVYDIDEFRERLEELGFVEQVPQDDHGQVYGLALRLNEYEQIHVKVMPDGFIEAEIEPPPAYPGAHLNPEHSYSAHYELERTLLQTGVRYERKIRTPLTCIKRVIKRPAKPTHVTTIVLGVALTVGIAAVLYAVAKGGRK